MALIKTHQEINQILQGGKIIGRILEDLGKMVQPGMSTAELDVAAEKMILSIGGRPAFKNFKNHPKDIPFPSTICASINEELVHGIARKDVILKDGDIFKIDIGMEWPTKKDKIKEQGYFTDTAITVVVGGKRSAAVKKLLEVTSGALEVGIKAAKPGNSVADIGKAIQKYVESQGNYGIVRDLVGHGVGHAVHEDPRVPNYYDRSLEKFILKPGMVIAIEPMIAIGDWQVETGPDGWTIVMSDGSLCAHFEHTVVITEKGNKVATRRPGEQGCR
jgi:methionyl aminopeptidase